MKKLLVLIFCIAFCLPVLADESFNPENEALTYLTEVYGYTYEEAQKFKFIKERYGFLLFYHPDTPQWAYRLVYENNQVVFTETPYSISYTNYPSEGTVRWLLQRFDEEKLLDNITQNKAKLRHILTENNVSLSPDLENMLTEQKDISYSKEDFLHEYFVSCFGDEFFWTDAIKDWHDRVLAANGYNPSKTSINGDKGVNVSTNKTESGGTITISRFNGELPDELKEAIANEKRLSGYNVLCGVLRTTHVPDGEIGISAGLAVFEKEKQRQLMILRLNTLEKPYTWEFYPVSKNAVLDSTWDIAIDYVESDYSFRFNYQKDDEKIILDVYPAFDAVLGDNTNTLVYIKRYEIISNKGKNRFIMSPVYQNNWSLTEINESKRNSVQIALWFPSYLGAISLSDFPGTIEEAKKAALPQLPDNYMMTGNVNFRQKTSSHSNKLGTLYEGAILPVIAQLPGDPNDWIQTKVGDIEGYVVITYTSLDEAIGSLVSRRPLPVAKLKQDAALKDGTGLFSKTKAELKEDQIMHVVMDCGNWQYVVIPQGALGWFMDTDGLYGYIKKDQLDIALTLPQLEWNSGL